MRPTTRLARQALGLCLLAMVASGSWLLAAPAQAQTPTRYRCVVGDRVQIQTTPCSPVGRGTQIITAGPLEPSPQPYVPPRSSYSRTEAPAHHKYLRGQCAQMAEGIRTAYARGAGNTLGELQADYRRRCAEEEAEASSALSKERSDQRTEKMEQQKAQVAMQTAEQRNRDGCAALGDTIAIRRKREPQMNDSERAAFKQSEAAFFERCR